MLKGIVDTHIVINRAGNGWFGCGFKYPELESVQTGYLLDNVELAY